MFRIDTERLSDNEKKDLIERYSLCNPNEISQIYQSRNFRVKVPEDFVVRHKEDESEEIGRYRGLAIAAKAVVDAITNDRTYSNLFEVDNKTLQAVKW